MVEKEVWERTIVKCLEYEDIYVSCKSLIKYWSSLSLGLFSCDINLLYAEHPPGFLCIIQSDLVARGTKANVKVSLPAGPWVRKFFVSDPGVLYLLSASMKRWQANLLACKWDKKMQLLQRCWQFWQSGWNADRYMVSGRGNNKSPLWATLGDMRDSLGCSGKCSHPSVRQELESECPHYFTC